MGSRSRKAAALALLLPAGLGFAQEQEQQPVVLPPITVWADPLGGFASDSVTPPVVLSGENLDRRKEATIGETVKDVPGVSQTYFGPGASRPVIRRRAAGRRGDVAVAQAEPIVPAHRRGLIGEPETMKGFVQPVPAGVPREHSAGAVAPVCRRCEPHDQQPGSTVAESRHRSSPVAPSAELPLPALGHESAP